MIDPVSEIVASPPLSSETERLRSARKSLDYYNLNGFRHLPRRRESAKDFEIKPKISLPVTFAAIEALSRHLYNPGPLRTHPDPAANEYLQQVASKTHLNLLSAKADSWALLHGASAIGITATPARGTGSCRLDVFGAHELVVWCPDDDPAAPYAVCVLGYDRASKRRRYTLWTAETHTTFEGAEGEKPAKITEIPNPYKVIPFTFYHVNGPVVSEFWEGGLGEYLSQLNTEADVSFSDSAAGLAAVVPIGWARNCNPSTSFNVGSGLINFLTPSDSTGMGPPPEIGYTQSPYDARIANSSMFGIIESAIELLGVPPSAIRSSASTATSGIALLLEQVPLLTNAKKRQQYTDIFEQELAGMILTAMGSFYRNEAWLRAAQIPISISWPAFTLPVPFPDQDQSDQQLIDWGLQSIIDIACKRFNISREQALIQIQKASADKILVESLGNPATPPADEFNPNPLNPPEPQKSPGVPDQNPQQGELI